MEGKRRGEVGKYGKDGGRSGGDRGLRGREGKDKAIGGGKGCVGKKIQNI